MILRRNKSELMIGGKECNRLGMSGTDYTADTYVMCVCVYIYTQQKGS